MNVVLIYNSTSGGNYNARTLKSLLKKNGVTVDYSFTVTQLRSKKLAQLISNGVIVVAVGGDGTLSSAARLLVGTRSSLLPLPGGTFNHFIRDLGMSPRLEDSLAFIKNAEHRKIDVAYVNDEIFLNNSNLGLYPFSIAERKRTKKLIGKWPAAVLSAFDQLVAFRRYKLVIDGEKVKSPFVFVGNNVYDIKASLIPERKKLDAGLLTFMIASSPSRIALIRDIFAVVRGDVSRRDDFIFETRERLEIYCHKPQLLVSMDGEVKKLATPLVYTIKPKALKVLIVKE